MRVVVSDTGPLHYLLLVDQIELLAALFARVVVPVAVCAELRHPAAPDPVRRWAASSPTWLTSVSVAAEHDPALLRLDEGEAAAISLALSLRADLVLMDERAGVATARARGLTVVGTIGILDLAASRGGIDIADVVARLKRTNFRYRPTLLDDLVTRHRRRLQDQSTIA